jgi:cell division protein FtsN
VSNRQRLTARDYKSARHGQFAWQRWRELGIGLGIGLLVALVVYVSDHRAGEALAARGPDAPRALDPAARPGTAGAAARAARAARAAPGAPVGDEAPASGAPAEGSYAFYDMLPKFEVVVPEREHGTRVDAAAKVERPGTYFLQAGSYHKPEDAERVRAQLARQNIAANVQRVALDTDVWFRIRVGPIKDLAQLNRLRQQLQSADIDSLVIRVEE